jgi:hypothetical protein
MDLTQSPVFGGGFDGGFDERGSSSKQVANTRFAGLKRGRGKSVDEMVDEQDKQISKNRKVEKKKVREI